MYIKLRFNNIFNRAYQNTLIGIGLLALTACNLISQNDKPIPREIILKYEDNISLSYPEVIHAYESLAQQHQQAKLFTAGPTDFGKPLHLFVISSTCDFDPESLHSNNMRIIMVNNGIHPGEPCGIDASIKLARDILNHENGIMQLLDSTVLCIIPVYNIGGAHNRSAYNRANQNGPIEQGFRGNAKNLDLNRDFAPMNSRNAQSFATLFHMWKPHLLIDTHTTNGADYQYVMTLIPNHPEELPPMLGQFYDTVMNPWLYEAMAQKGYEMIPYVSPRGTSIENGLQQYFNTPRYTTGYGRMFNTITFMTEAHMFKPFRDRVLATYSFIASCLEFANVHGHTLINLKERANEFVANKKEYVIQWKPDSIRFVKIPFKGYETEWSESEITGQKRLSYNREKPYTKDIPYYKYYHPALSITAPEYYIIPQAWHEIIHRLELNKVDLFRLGQDTLLEVEAYYIKDYKTRKTPYNGHYMHYDVELTSELQLLTFYEGDYIIPVNQPANQFIIEMLEPQAEDSYFVWNYFDPVLQRKEYFSSYIFEDYAAQLLAQDNSLYELFESKKANDHGFASNAYRQLQFLYEHSPYYEKSHLRYPIFRHGLKP